MSGKTAMSRNRDKKDREREKRRQRRQRQKAKQPIVAAARQLLQSVPPNTQIIGAIPGMPKASEQLLAFVEPYGDPNEPLEGFRKLIMLGMLAWNMGVSPPEKRKDLLVPLLETLGGVESETAVPILAMIAEMIHRKETDPRFAQDRRYLLNYTLTETPDGPHLQVLSTVPT